MENEKIKILSIDDYPDNLLILEVLINDSLPDAIFISALNGIDGLRLAEAEDPDVILLDIMMPGIDGFEVCKRLKDDKRLRDIPVIFVTAITDNRQYYLRALESGGEAFLSKPFEQHELTAQIRAMVKIKQANTEKHHEKERLMALVAERTMELEQKLAEQKKAEEALRESEDKFKYIFDYSPVGKSITMLSGEMNANQAFYDMLGYTPGELLQTKWQDLTHPDDIVLTQREIDSLINGEQEVSSIVKRYIHKNGSIVWCDLHCSLRRDKDGNPLYFLSTIVDITIKKISEDRLRDSEMRLRNIFDQSPVGSVVVGMDSRFIKCNPAFCNFLGYTEDELIGKQYIEITWREDRELGLMDMKLIVEGKKETTTLQKRYQRKDGAIVWGEITISLVRDGDNNPMHFLAIIQDISKRKHAEAALSESEEKFQSLYSLFRLMSDTMPDMLWAKDLNQQYLFANKSMCQNLLNAVDTQEPIGKTDIYFANRERGSHPEDPSWHTFGEICMDTDAIILKEMREMQFDEYGNVKGKFIFLDVHKAPLYNDKGELIGIVGTARDVTERKLMEDSLRESENLYRKMNENSPLGMHFYKLNNENKLIFVDANPAADKLLGVDNSQFIGKTIDEAFPPLIQTEVPERYLEAAKNGISWATEQIAYKDQRITGAFEVRAFQTSPGNMVAVFSDVTERKLAHEALIESEERYRAVSQSAVDAIITSDLKGVILGWNRGAEKIFGYTEKEMIGEVITKIIPLNYVDQHNEGIKRVENGGEKRVIGKIVELHGLHKNGNEFPVELSMASWKTSTGKYFTGIIRDITERKIAEQELINAKEKAEESDRLKSSFLANMSHEIRTPMNSIMGFASLLPEEESKELMVNYASIIVRSSEQLVHIIDDIVLYSRLQTRLLSNIPTPFNVHNILTDVKLSFSLPEFQKGVELIIETGLEEAVWIRSDYDKVQQILTNLVSNAFKYTKEGAITIGFSSKDNGIEFFVRDTGMGIDPEELGKVFDRFYRGSNVNKGVIGGTGLGLCIVKELAELLGGNIWVESEIYKGSTFYFTLPVYSW